MVRVIANASHMSADSIISLLLSVPIGIISGFYSGLIVTRYARFAELRNETLRIIRGIDFVDEGRQIQISNDGDVSKLVLVASDLFFLNHMKAGEKVGELSKAISNTNYDARAGRVGIEEYSDRYGQWQAAARSLPANKTVVWSFWAKL